MFSLWLLLKLWSSGVWYYVLWLIGASVLEKPAGSVFKVQELPFS
jgi:hypothetical protein